MYSERSLKINSVLFQELCKKCSKFSCGCFQLCSRVHEGAAAKVGTNWVEVGIEIRCVAQNTVLQAVNTKTSHDVQQLVSQTT